MKRSCDGRHADSSQIVIECMQLLPSEIINATLKLQASDLTNLSQLYEHDLPSFRSLDAEVDLWQNKWAGESQLAVDLNTPERSIIDLIITVVTSHAPSMLQRWQSALASQCKLW